MYDKIVIWKSRRGDEYPHLVTLLEDAKEQTDLETGEIKTYGTLQGMRVGIYPTTIRIEGSLPKFLYAGGNVIPLNRHTTEEAIKKLSDALQINLEDAGVSSLEFGANFLMRHKPSEYLKRMGELPRRQRYTFNVDTLYYRHRGKEQPDTFCMYDKISDAKAKGMPIPQGFEDKNLLRVELRLNGSLAKQMGVPEVAASTLYDRQFYAKIRNRFINTYFSISKLNKLNTHFMESIKTPKDAVDGFLGLMLAKAGGMQEIDAYLEELKANQVFADRVNYKRTRDALYKAASKAKLSSKDELVAELDDCFINLKANGG